MNIESLIIVYGYPALLVGAFFEGETIVLTAGFLAHRGYFHLPLVMLVAFVGALIGDQFYFHLGRTGGTALLERRPLWRERAQKVRALLERHQIPIILGFRFFYGFRIVTPIVIGMSRFNAWTFLLLNTIGALIWASAIAGAGYVFGQLLQTRMKAFGRHELYLALAILVIGAGLAAFRFLKWKRRCANPS